MNKRILIGIVIIAAAIIGIKMFTTTVENVATDTTKDVLNNVVKANLKPVVAAIKNQQLCQSGADT
ncbi:hypothetical protein CTM76_03900 [Photobacterium phosphoreum]|nr:hypothetical protein [Photobacterium phosphoreum]PSU80413.1 hypothetical protein CTM76_03900 [Photobacterium phosphoreum]